MFSEDLCQAVIVECVEPLGTAQLRSNDYATLDTELVVNDPVITKKDVKRAYRPGLEPWLTSARPTKAKVLKLLSH